MENITQYLVEEKIYLKSPYLDINTSEASGKSTIHNIISGKTYEVSPLVAQILLFFNQQNSIEGLALQYGIGESDLAKTIQYLLDTKMLIESSDKGWENFTTDVIAAKNRLFGVEGYHKKAKTVLVGVPFGKGNGKSQGGSEFPFQIREYSQKSGYSLQKSTFPIFDEPTAKRLQAIFSKNQLADFGNMFISTNESSAFIYEKMYQIAAKIFEKEQIPAFIGGDHSVSYPLIKAAAQKYPNLHILHFDAHTDTYSSRYDAVHHWGKTHHYGNFMSHCLALPQVAQVYQFGIRGVSNINEKEQAKQKIFWRHEISRKLELNGSFDLPKDVPYYVTFDVDVLDPSIMPGTATPIPSGFNLREIKRLLDKLLIDKQIIGFDIVEANNDFDKTDLTNQVFLEILLQLLSYVKT
jgi:agmatinase